MNLSVIKHGLLAIGVALLMLAGTVGAPQPTTAAPRAGFTPTAEPPTRTPTPANPTATPGVPPTKTPRPRTGIADPAITKSVDIGDARVGDEVVFSITATNLGTITADDVVVTDPIPDYMDVIEATTTKGNVSSEGRTVIVTIGPIAPGEEVSIRIRVRINERAQPPGARNTVSLTSSSPDANPNNNSAEATFNIVAQATATPTADPLATPTATPLPPVTLPATGAAGDSSNHAALFAALGLLALALSLVLRMKASK
jgi:uncharacterized repeat protein (TIGR01451 family)